MLNLDGILSKDDIQAVRTFTELRFADSKSLKTPEALVLWEEGYLSSEAIKQLCERYYGEQLYEPVNSYVPDEVLQAYRNTGCVPVSFESMKQRIVLVAVHDFDVSEELTYRDYTIQVKYTTLNYYLKVYSKAYGIHPCLREIPAKLSFESIIREAINLGAIDVTVDSERNCTRVFYNVRKKRVDSAKVYSSEFMNKLIELLTFSSPMDMEAAKPKDLDVDLNSEYRGRVQINPTVYGFSVTIRLLPNRVFNLSLGDLSLSEKTKHFLETAFLDRTPGLRLMVGATMAGKNTTLLSVLNTIVKNGNYKVVSIEMPVEQKLPGVIQKQKFFISGSRLDTEIDVLSDLRFPCRTILIRLPFFVFSATLITRNDDGKIVLPAQLITQFPDVIIGLFAVVIFVMFDVVSSAKNDVIMNVSFINMGGYNIRIFPL